MDKTVKYTEIKSTSPKLEQSELARALQISSSTLQRYRRELNMPSSYRIPLSSNTHTRKQKTSNHTVQDLKMNSNDLKMTSNDIKITSNESIKYKKNKMKEGMPDDNPSHGRDLIEQAFSFT